MDVKFEMPQTSSTLTSWAGGGGFVGGKVGGGCCGDCGGNEGATVGGAVVTGINVGGSTAGTVTGVGSVTAAGWFVTSGRNVNMSGC